MAATIETFRVQQYATNVRLLVQQTDSRFSALVENGSHVGKAASPVEQVGQRTARQRTSRYAAIVPSETPTDRRWVYPLDYDDYQFVDRQDKLRLIVDPTSMFTQSAVAAMLRAKDDAIISAFFADAKSGEAGGSTSSFLAGNQVDVNFESASNVNLTVAKLRKAKQLLMSHDIDLSMEQPYIAVNSLAHDSLLKEIQVVNTDYNVARDGVPVLKEAMIDRFMGFNFIHSERLGTDTSSYRRLPVWVRSGMYLGMWDDLEIDVSQRKDIEGHPWQISVMGTWGATRLEEKRVVEIKCAE